MSEHKHKFPLYWLMRLPKVSRSQWESESYLTEQKKKIVIQGLNSCLAMLYLSSFLFLLLGYASKADSGLRS